MKILFITRKFPPTVGGLENAAYHLHKSLAKSNEVKLIKWGGSNAYLPIVLPIHLLRAVLALLFNKVDVIYIQDGVLAPMGVLLKWVFKKPVVISIAGLDITYENRIFQKFFASQVKKHDKVISISEKTEKEVLARGVPKKNSIIIPYGVEDKLSGQKKDARDHIQKIINADIKNKTILLSVGRLVERKGVHWFVANVLDQLRKDSLDFVYIIAGSGPYLEKIKKIVSHQNLQSNLVPLGRVSDRELMDLYNAADIFVMPNIKVKGDVEGQGLVLLEAASAKNLVIASDVDGISSTITNHKNGILVPEKDKKAFARNIKKYSIDLDGRRAFTKKARQYTMRKYSWDTIAVRYKDLFSTVINK